MKTKREIRKQIFNTGTKQKEREVLKKRDELITAYISKNQQKAFVKKINETINEITQTGGLDGGNFWEFKKRMDNKKREERIAMKDKGGNVHESPKSIKEIFANFYEELLGSNPARNEEEEKNEEEVEKMFRQFELIAESDVASEITEKDVLEAIKKLKKKKAADQDGMKNEMIISGGKDLLNSIIAMFNKILKEKEIPSKWENMRIKSIYKNKGSKAEMKNRRGLFITNIIGKLYEKVIAIRNTETIERYLSPYQCGGVKDRGTADHLFTLRALMEYYAYMNKDLYVFFGDLEKCFDKLWLKDCIIELWRSGMPPAEIYTIYLMNRSANAVIETPVGETRQINLKEIVRQGTVFGPILCGIVTDKISRTSGQVVERIWKDLEIGTLTFVDDICGAGSQANVEATIKRCKEMETKKKMTFNVEKSNYLIITNSKKKKEEIKVELSKGPVTRVQEYKYLGDYFVEKGDHGENIRKRKTKGEAAIQNMLRIADPKLTGKMSIQICLKIMETMIIPMILHNSETWTNLKSKDIEELEKIQKHILNKIFGMSANNPYWGILAETGTWPMEKRIHYKKAMFLHHLIKSDEKRIAKQVLKKQKEMDNWANTWYKEIEDITKRYKIEISFEELEKTKKSEWKKKVKQQIKEKIQKEFIEKTNKMKKLRFIKDDTFKMKEYIIEGESEEVKKMMKIRLNMIEIKGNFKGNFRDGEYKCPLCKKENDGTEHLYECEEIVNVIDKKRTTIKSISSEKITEQRRVMKYIENAMMLREMRGGQ